MVGTSLELECSKCGEKFWYNGEKNHPETVECPKCNRDVEIAEEG